MQRFVNRVCLVTGASSGIGAQTARTLSAEGATVFLTGRSKERLSAVQKSLAADSKSGLWVGDLTTDGSPQACVDAAVAEFGQLDVVVNNAGILSMGTAESTTDEQWTAMMATNVEAVWKVFRAAVPHLKKSHGSAVMVSSVNGLRSFPGVFSYCISKAAVDQMVRCAALELAADGVRVNAVNPGVIESELQKRGGLDDEKYAAFLEKSKTTHPLGRHGQPEEVAKAIAFLASDDASFITGATVPVDGGRHATCLR